MTKKLSQDRRFARLIADLRKILREAEERAKLAGRNFYVSAYWEMGKIIHQEGITEKLTLRELARALEEEESLLNRIVKLYRLWPNLPRLLPGQSGQLSWSHFKLLMTLENSQERDFYLQQAAENNWPRDLLSQKIKDNYFATKEAQKKKKTQKPGKQILERRPNRLHLYRANTTRVVDGDTIDVLIDLGFDAYLKERLRLRGIDCPELSSEEGKRAKRFVEQRLPPNRPIVIQTFKTDLHGRYVADIFYLEGERDKEFIATEGNFLNQELLSAGLAELV